MALTVALLLLCTGCDALEKFLPTGAPDVEQTSSEVTSSSSSKPLDTSGAHSVTDTASKPQNTTSKKPAETQSVTSTSSAVSTPTVSESEIEINPYAKNLCYGAITSEQQRIYRIMLSAIKNITTDWIWLGNCSEVYLSDIAVAYRAVTYDYPELFWVPYTYVVNKGETGVKLAFELTSGSSDKKYLVEPHLVEAKQAELEAAAQRIISQVEGVAKTPYERVLYLHDLLVENITYSDTLDEDMVYTVYGALVNQSAVCEGYARAMSYLCEKMGIRCILITGRSKNQGHMWNLVRLENKWYHVDVTWDDVEKTIEYPLHTYFCITDEQIVLDHTIDPDVTQVSVSDKAEGLTGYNFNLPECTATRYNYFEQTGYYIGDDLLAAAKHIEKICKYQFYIEFKFQTPEKLAEFSALNKQGRDAYIIALAHNVVSPIPGWKFTVSQYALIGDCLYLEW